MIEEATTPSPTSTWDETRPLIVQALENHDFAVEELDSDTLRVTLPGESIFASGSTRLLSSFQTSLDRIAGILHSHPHTLARIVGHTDSVGSELANLELSIERAEAVMNHLIGRGIPFTRVSADGRGEAEPIADNANPQGRALNRRVEIFLQAQPSNGTH